MSPIEWSTALSGRLRDGSVGRSVGLVLTLGVRHGCIPPPSSRGPHRVSKGPALVHGEPGEPSGRRPTRFSVHVSEIFGGAEARSGQWCR